MAQDNRGVEKFDDDQLKRMIGGVEARLDALDPDWREKFSEWQKGGKAAKRDAAAADEEVKGAVQTVDRFLKAGKRVEEGKASEVLNMLLQDEVASARVEEIFRMLDIPTLEVPDPENPNEVVQVWKPTDNERALAIGFLQRDDGIKKRMRELGLSWPA